MAKVFFIRSEHSRLTINGKKTAGWIFPKSKEQRLACYFGLDYSIKYQLGGSNPAPQHPKI